MSKISPCLWFTNQVEEAANFYISLLPDSRIDRVTRSVVDLPSGPAGSVLLVSFTLAGQEFLALNGGAPQEHTHAISFSIDCADQAEVDHVWNRLCDGGTPVQCGWVRDRYGMSWQVVPSMLPKLLRDPDTEKARRVMQAMMRMVKLDVAALQAAYDGPGMN
jgi:predicted 3-demethylubiquinone-9 3-methyltransferase (glyoxalase superfamily)